MIDLGFLSSSITPEVVTAAVAAAVGFAARHKFFGHQAAVGEVAYYANIVVQAAEEAFGHLDNAHQQKFLYAKERLVERTGINEDEATAYILAAVKGLRLTGVKPRLSDAQIAARVEKGTTPEAADAAAKELV